MIAALAAAVVVAPLVECVLNMLMSMPAFSRMVLGHLATVDSASWLCCYHFQRLPLSSGSSVARVKH